MNSLFFITALLLFSADEPLPRLPVVPQQPSPIPTRTEKIPPVTNVLPDNEIRINGILELPKRNNVILAATERAVLTSLKTEQRDMNGNTVTDAAGQPVLVPVTEGMYVFKGQILGNFDDRELRSTLAIGQAQLDVAKAEREKKIEIEYARLGAQVAKAEFRMMEEANKRHAGTYPLIEVAKSRLAVDQANANVELQTYTIEEVKAREVAVREIEIERTKVLIDLRKLIAPLDGIVVKINQTEGEWLREGDPVLEIMQLNTLRFLGKIPYKKYAVDKQSVQSVTIYATFPDEKKAVFSGQVVFVSPKIVVGDGTYEIYIEVKNRWTGNSWQLQPGRDAEAVIQLNDNAVSGQ